MKQESKYILFIYDLLNGAVIRPILRRLVASANNYLESLLQEAIVAQFMVLFLHLFGGAGESHEKPQS
jgi:hypothetical protein